MNSRRNGPNEASVNTSTRTIMADDKAADVFAIPDFWKSSKLLDLPPGQESEFFNFDNEGSQRPHWTLVDSEFIALESSEFFKLPSSLQRLGPVAQDKGQDDIPIDIPKRRRERIRYSDIFSHILIENEGSPLYHPELKSWDGFTRPDSPEVSARFLTESGPAAYDAALSEAEDHLKIRNTTHRVVETNPYLGSLLALALGRASIFFSRDEAKSSYTLTLEKIRISGFSADVLQGIQGLCVQCGNISHFLSVFVQITYKAHPSPGKVALAKAIDGLLLVIQTKLGAHARQIRSLLQLQSLIQPVHSILRYFKSLINKLNKCRTDEQVLSKLFEETHVLEHGDDLLSDIMRVILSRVSEPWADFVQKWIGVRSEAGNPMTKDGPGRSFVKVENVAFMDDFGIEVEEPDYVLDETRMPSFVPDEISQTMFEVGRNLRLLHVHHPDHPLCHVGLVQSNQPPILEWHFDWNSIERLQSEVDKYETSLLQTIRLHLAGSGYKSHVANEHRTAHVAYELQLFGREENELVERLMASIEELNQPFPVVDETDALSRLLHKRLFEDKQSGALMGLSLSPHWSLLPLLSFGPLVQAQARLINREYVRLLFKSHKLRSHIALQKQFQLLGNGVFCSRLSHALFDPELETAERQAGIARNGGVMGLRLEGRDSWPPASSELRLALMGVLAESYLPLEMPLLAESPRETHDLPGDLSFAVRDLTEEEINRCLNPGSLEALDFLRLSYKPPAPLVPVITPVILVKYDRIFKLLLRILRMVYVAGELFRDTNGRASRWHDIDNVSRRFRIEARHFIASVTAYFFDTGIGVAWGQFELWLDKVQSDLEKDDAAPKSGHVLSPDELREHHEHVLDQIMHTLLLRKRQQPVLKLLEDIFTLILKFSRLARREAMGKTGNDTKETSSPKELYNAFKKKMDVFITVCRGLSEKEGLGSKQKKNDVAGDETKHGGISEESTIDRLLIQLEMSGYYGGSRY